LCGFVVRSQTERVIKTMLQAGYHSLLVVLLSKIEGERIDLMTSLMWQVGMICSESSSNLNPSHMFLQINLIDVMLQLKAKIGD
jgi:hypothetical protein